ncbi:MAG: hypothetical protein IPK28_14595 [Devosia sp.]|nr:hypothetical protein [Devosia sp.]
MLAPAATTDDGRDRLYRGLVRRNRVVAALRIGVPALGAAVLAVLVVQIAIDNLRDQFGFSNLRIDRDHLVIDTPALNSVGSDGTLYALTAADARVAISAAEMIELTDAAFTMTPPLVGPSYTALAAVARLDTRAQQLFVDDDMRISGSDGMTGTLTGVFADFIVNAMRAAGPVALTLADGSTVEAESMTYDGRSQLFSFRKATVTLHATPGAAP